MISLPRLVCLVKQELIFSWIIFSILESYEFTNKNNNLNNDILKPGTIIGVIENEGIVISTKTNPIIILEAKLEGKNLSSKMQLIQQLQPIVGEKFSD